MHTVAQHHLQLPGFCPSSPGSAHSFPCQTENICAQQTNRSRRNTPERSFSRHGREEPRSEAGVQTNPGRALLRAGAAPGARGGSAQPPPRAGPGKNEPACACTSLQHGMSPPSLLLFWRVRVCLSVPPPPTFSIRLLCLALLTHHLWIFVVAAAYSLGRNISGE